MLLEAGEDVDDGETPPDALWAEFKAGNCGGGRLSSSSSALSDSHRTGTWSEGTISENEGTGPPFA
jgi:hypothetical protein